MHVITRHWTEYEENSNVRSAFNTKLSKQEMVDQSIRDRKQEIRECGEEKQKISKFSGKAASFLVKTAMLTHNDAVTGYLDFELQKEKRIAERSGDWSKFNSLEVKFITLSIF